jgi:integrase/recombinase XerC
MNYLQPYLDYLKFERGLSTLTIENYQRDILQMLALANLQEDQSKLNSITASHIRLFIGKLHSQKLSGKSLARMLSAWHGLFSNRWCLKTIHARPSNPLKALRHYRMP